MHVNGEQVFCMQVDGNIGYEVRLGNQADWLTFRLYFFTSDLAKACDKVFQNECKEATTDGDWTGWAVPLRRTAVSIGSPIL